MNAKIRKILKVVLTAALVIGIVCYGKSLFEKQIGQREYEEARMIATGGQGLPTQTTEKTPAVSTPTTSAEGTPPDTTEEEETVITDPYVEQLKVINLAALKAVNPEVIAWIYIPDTIVNYPVLQHADNDYYLDHTWKDTGNYVGSIFMDSQNAADLSNFNTILYGHNMNNKAMFCDLDEYSSLEYLQAHPSIYIVTETGIYRYDVFSVHRAGMKTIAFGMDMHTTKKRTEFINFALDYSELNTGIVPDTDDSFLTLATCSYNREKVRLVIQAVLNPQASYIRDK